MFIERVELSASRASKPLLKPSLKRSNPDVSADFDRTFLNTNSENRRSSIRPRHPAVTLAVEPPPPQFPRPWFRLHPRRKVGA